MTFDGLDLGAYRHIVCDPPWRYEQVDRTKAEARLQYSTMTVDELEALDVASLAHPDGAVLWLWATNRMLANGTAPQLALAWGFTPLTIVTWGKTGQPGVGWRLRSITEHCIVAVVGYPSLPDPHRVPASLQMWQRASGGRSALSKSHSKKPAAFYDLVEQYSPGPYVDLFQRAGRLGWDGWGRGFEGPASGPVDATVAR